MLTDKGLKALKPREKPYKVADGNGLSVLVRPDGARWWRFRYRYGGREKMISLGTYPDTSLKLARDERDACRKQLAAGIDPSAKRQAEKEARADTFEGIANEWLAKNQAISDETRRQLLHRLKTYVFPYLGRWPIVDIGSPDLLKVLRRIESKGTIETAHRVRSLCGRIFRYAVATGRAERDPTGDLKGAITSVKTQNFAAITEPKRLGALLRAIDGYQGQPAVIAALKLAPLLFVRPGELRAAEWSELEVNGDEPQWVIPASRMKMSREHVVPLSRQAIAIIEDLRPITGAGTLLFPSLRASSRPISDNTLNAALRALGYNNKTQVAHGFRATASTLLHELGWASDVIECQLAHARPGVGGIYNRAHRLVERRKMMQAWADYLDGLKAGATVTAIGAKP